MSTPHPWLGVEFKALLAPLRKERRTVKLAVTSPPGRSVGQGALRVLRVKSCAQNLHLLLAYEGYREKHAGLR